MEKPSLSQSFKYELESKKMYYKDKEKIKEVVTSMIPVMAFAGSFLVMMIIQEIDKQ